jgi:hypothetical protein
MQVAPTLYVHINVFFSHEKLPDFYSKKTLATTTKDKKGGFQFKSLKSVKW